MPRSWAGVTRGATFPRLRSARVRTRFALRHVQAAAPLTTILSSERNSEFVAEILGLSDRIVDEAIRLLMTRSNDFPAPQRETAGTINRAYI